MLALQNLTAGYSRSAIVHNITLELAEKEIVTLIGTNGAGKSTLLLTISGMTTVLHGSVALEQQSLHGLSPQAIAQRRIAHVPEGRRVFARLSVRENLLLGATIVAKNHHKKDLDRVFSLFPRLAERQHQRAGTLSGGEQQMLAIGRGLMSRPKVLLLDEPSLGLAPLVIKQIFEAIRQINAVEGVAVLLVEQNAHAALRLAHRGYVLQKGRVVLEGESTALLNDPFVRQSYLEGSG
ncbi:MAG: ABC transporter ATP-binding protein [Holosporales bacterium]